MKLKHFISSLLAITLSACANSPQAPKSSAVNSLSGKKFVFFNDLANPSLLRAEESTINAIAAQVKKDPQILIRLSYADESGLANIIARQLQQRQVTNPISIENCCLIDRGFSAMERGEVSVTFMK